MKGITATLLLFAFLYLLTSAANAADYTQQYRQQQYQMALPAITVHPTPQPTIPLIFAPLLLPIFIVDALFSPVPVPLPQVQYPYPEYGYSAQQYAPQYYPPTYGDAFE